MVDKGDLVAIFHSIHRVMKVEKILKREGLPFQLIPVPRQLASDCGLAIRYGEAQAQVIMAVFQQEQLIPAELYRYDGADFQREEV